MFIFRHFKWIQLQLSGSLACQYPFILSMLHWYTRDSFKKRNLMLEATKGGEIFPGKDQKKNNNMATTPKNNLFSSDIAVLPLPLPLPPHNHSQSNNHNHFQIQMPSLLHLTGQSLGLIRNVNHMGEKFSCDETHIERVQSLGIFIVSLINHCFSFMLMQTMFK